MGGSDGHRQGPDGHSPISVSPTNSPSTSAGRRRGRCGTLNRGTSAVAGLYPRDKTRVFSAGRYVGRDALSAKSVESDLGRARSYQWVADRVGGKQYARAVGRALGANPVPIVVPCHRIIAQDGSLGGFSGGLPMKRRLLRLEGTLAQLRHAQ
jgi:O-6-methylguanine DNA methyltransferase